MFRIENPGRGLQQPPFGGRVTNSSGGQGLMEQKNNNNVYWNHLASKENVVFAKCYEQIVEKMT